MSKDETFSIEIPMNNPKTMEAYEAFMDPRQDAFVKYELQVAKELGCSEHAASDIAYLRSRPRWTQELENELVKLDKLGKHPPVLAGWFGEPESDWDKISPFWS